MTSQTADTAANTATGTADEILAALRAMLTEVIGEDYLLDLDISPETSFNDDLGIESVEFVQLSVMLQERYGDHIDFVSFMADLGVEEIMNLTVGQLVSYIEAGVSHG
jgi:acyl carrier protein